LLIVEFVVLFGGEKSQKCGDILVTICRSLPEEGGVGTEINLLPHPFRSPTLHLK